MKVLYDKNQIQKEIARVGAQISKDYEGQDFLVIGVLKGCTIFMSHLLMEIKGDLAIDFMTLSSYKHGTESGELKMVQDLDTDITRKKVLIVEDIVDTGKTLAFTQKYLRDRGAASVETVTLVDKPTRRKYHVELPKYTCFRYEDAPFLLGFGFDYQEKFRNLPEIYQMEESDF